MSEKGGKGFSLPTGKAVKSSLKSTPSTKDASLKGKDDSSTKSKKGRKVQFDSEGLHEPKSNFSSKFDNPAAASGKDWGKGGKGDKVGNGRKKEPQPLELKIEQELPQSAKCLMDCEAADILQGIQEQIILLSKDPLLKSLYHSTRDCSTPKEPATILIPNLSEKFLNGEISVIANVCPETTDEVFALVPSLKTTRSVLSQPLKEVLSELTKLKQST